MTKPAVEFQAVGDELRLIYRPRDDTAWVERRFDAGEPLFVKGTFRLTRADLVGDDTPASDDSDDIVWPEDQMVFVVANAEGDYFCFKPEVLGFDEPVLLYREARPDWKWFSAERRVSILGVIQSLGLAFDTAGRSAEIHQQIWMVEGCMEFTVGGTPWRLKAGDCLALKLDAPMVFRNPTRQRARYLVALASPFAAGRSS